jgi:hypothetical protein
MKEQDLWSVKYDEADLRFFLNIVRLAFAEGQSSISK